MKSEFPINLWPNAVYVYHARIRSFVESGETWEHFGRALLTSQGSDFRDAEVNFFRATDRRGPEGWAEAGLHMGFYYSLLEWRHPLCNKNDIGKFVEQVNLPQLKELVVRYRPEIVWTDVLAQMG